MNTIAMIEQLATIPRMFGEPLYPGGAPLQPENHHWQDQSVKDIALKYYEAKDLTKDEFRFLKEYLIYYTHAPIWLMHATDEYRQLIKSSFAIKTVQELSEFEMNLLDFGLDPL